ncbi:hypothetical protein PMG11_11298 [Penicillium brasilianum]|uniref:Transcription factor domain-containing protein n=1 Tax=Penicillium brasilianum TaxID=104259 RepID=A0A0F7U3G1_PENBI|nr:hypothetical protein PMG11_11298 [Penicillium brasilianum]
MLSKQDADMLIQSFLRRYRSNYFISNLKGIVLDTNKDLRATSPFLHAVCCLHGMVSEEEYSVSPLHREVYEEVRRKLGQVLLATPLPLEELLAISAMCLFASAPSVGPEYIDSWVLSGHCAQQAMLTINFAKISANIKSGDASLEDQKDVRLWGSICLNHLQWAAATGRPSFLPPHYTAYCLLTLDIGQATIDDAMNVAEIMLYSSIVAPSERLLSLSTEGDCPEIEAWSQKWKHLFNMPQSICLKLGYHIAYLILAKRALNISRANHSHASRHMSTEEDFTNSKDKPSGSTNADRDTERTAHPGHRPTMFEVMVVDSAILVLQTLSRMSDNQTRCLPVFYSVCITYSILVVSHYRHSSSEISDESLLGLLTRLKALSADAKMSSAMKFAIDKAMTKIATRSHKPICQQCRCYHTQYPCGNTDVIPQDLDSLRDTSHPQKLEIAGVEHDKDRYDAGREGAPSDKPTDFQPGNRHAGLWEDLPWDVRNCFEDFFSVGGIDHSKLEQMVPCV